MRKTYWIRYPRNFANEYDIVSATTEAQRKTLKAHGYERIPLKRVRELCSLERWRREIDPAFAYNASTEPITFEEAWYTWILEA